MRYGIVNIVLPPYFLFPLLMILNKSYFSLFHVNLNSLDAHLDDLHATLDLVGFPFQVIGASETRENVLRGFKMNNTLHGYNYLHSQPSSSAAGGVALYTSKSLNAVKRIDLSVTSEEFETVWVEIKILNPKIFCAVVPIGTLRPLLKDSLSILRLYRIT